MVCCLLPDGITPTLEGTSMSRTKKTPAERREEAHARYRLVKTIYFITGLIITVLSFFVGGGILFGLVGEALGGMLPWWVGLIVATVIALIMFLFLWFVWEIGVKPRLQPKSLKEYEAEDRKRQSQPGRVSAPTKP